MLINVHTVVKFHGEAGEIDCYSVMNIFKGLSIF